VKINHNKNFLFISLALFLSSYLCWAQTLEVEIEGYSSNIYLSNLAGEKTSLIDSANSKDGSKFSLSKNNLHSGICRISFDKNKWIDFINDGKNVSISTDIKNVFDSLRIIESESNKLFYSFLRLNRQYKTKTELLNLIISRFPKDDPYYNLSRQRLNELQNEYLEFVNITSQKEPASFIARYIRYAQLPVIDINLTVEKHVDYLKSNALNHINFNDALLINSDLFTNKTIEYLSYYGNPQFPKEMLEKEFMKSVDTLLNKAKVNQLVYQQITEYMIDGFKRFGFDQVLDYIVENYVIKDDLCLDEKTEGMIKRRIDQARILKIGSSVPEITLPDINGKQIDLNKIRAGKILIVFYASWCPHCKELLPQLDTLVKNQTEKKLEVLAVSLDTKKDEWINFITANCRSLINVSDLKGWNSKSADDYFIYATPSMFLIDSDRKIISKPTTFDELRKYQLLFE
jgi:peroxiredoxin